MPAFIDHVVTFCDRDDPHLQTSFRAEDDLTGSFSLNLAALGRSGIQLQHCFNLVGVEYDPTQKSDGPYFLRQAAAYFTFDLVHGRSAWIIIKANDVLKNRIHQATRPGQHRRTLANHETSEASLSAALSSHLLLFEWCIENWAAYVEHLEETLQELSAQVKYSQVKAMTTDERIGEEVSKRKPFHTDFHSRQNSDFSEKLKRSRSSSFSFKWLSSNTRENSMQMQSLNSPMTAAPSSETPKTEDFDFDKMFSFGNLQKLHGLSDKIEEARLTVSQDLDVLIDMNSRFSELQNSSLFKNHIDPKLSNFDSFLKTTQWCVREMGGWLMRLQSMSSRLNQDVSLVSPRFLTLRSLANTVY
jgi:hypothetical protein